MAADATQFLRAFGVIVAVWVSILAAAAPAVERPTVLWAGVALTWAWSIAAIGVGQRWPWVWGSGWLIMAIGLELLGPASGTDGWSVAGGSALLVIAAAALTQRRTVLLFVLGGLSMAVLARGIFVEGHTIGASLGTLVLFGFSSISVWWLVQTVVAGEQEREALRVAIARAEADRAVAQERAESAARLHDSVLQSLASIHRSDDVPAAREHADRASGEVRAWIRDRAASGQASLREAVEAVTREHGAGRTGFSSSGDGRTDENGRAIVDAVGEAVRNAVNHTEGEIRVFLECRDGRATAWISDHGPGFDVGAMAEDRHGVRNSIIGRMQRVGGTAQLRSTGDGTEWELSAPLA